MCTYQYFTREKFFIKKIESQAASDMSEEAQGFTAFTCVAHNPDSVVWSTMKHHHHSRHAYLNSSDHSNTQYTCSDTTMTPVTNPRKLLN